MEGTSDCCNLSSIDGLVVELSCHEIDAGSTAGRCTFFEQSTKTGDLDKLNFQQTQSNLKNQHEIDGMSERTRNCCNL